MKYTIDIDIPDELIAVAHIVNNPQSAQIVEQMGLELRGSSKGPTRTKEEIIALARKAAKDPIATDKVRAKMGELGLQKLSDLPEGQYDLFFDFLTSLTNK